MEQKFVTILGETYPATLDFLKVYNPRYMDSYTIQPVFYLFHLEREPNNALALINGSDRFILSTDSTLVATIKQKLWNILTKVDSNVCYVHKSEPVCYFNDNLTNSLSSDKETKVCQLLTKEELEILLKPFVWRSRLGEEKEMVVETKLKERY